MKKNKHIYILIIVFVCLFILSIPIIKGQLKEYRQKKEVSNTLEDLKTRIKKNSNLEITKEGTQIIQTEHKVNNITCLYSISAIKINDIDTVEENGFEKESGIYRIILEEQNKSPNYVFLLDMGYDTYISLHISNVPENINYKELYQLFNLE